jgi:1,2-diacylglycerol 3-beta-glucosyltransferase
MATTALFLASLMLAALVLPIWAYLGVLTLAAWRRRAPPADATRRLVCVVPAHNEEQGIARTVQSLLAATYPAALRRVLVVADNCTDRTADVARRAGALVLERRDDERRGKGFALEAGFALALSDQDVDGVIVVDADTIVADNLWRAVSARLAAGERAMQVTNAVRNPEAGWRPSLQAIAMAMINGVRSLGRERLGLSVGLRGTGMAFSRRTLEEVPHRVYGVVEDVEYGVRLGLAGIRVAFVPETFITSDAPVSAAAALTQRRRWEGGRLGLVRTMLPQLTRAWLRAPSRVVLDLAIDVLVPPISYPALFTLLGVGLEVAHVGVAGQLSPAAPLWALSILAALAYVLRGVAFSGTGLGGLAALGAAPAYVAWKLVVARPWRYGGAGPWVRTRRAEEEAPAARQGTGSSAP